MEITQDLEKRLQKMLHIFLEENTKLNLSALRTPELCWTGNILDSLALLDIVQELTAHSPQPKLVDIGTGGGFPLLPLAICLPDLRLTGIDATQKKIDAIARMVSALDLRNIDLLCGRTEDLGHHFREEFDIVTARAVAPINTLLEYCSPLAKVGGFVVLWKSMHIDEELKESLLARAELSCHLIKQYEYDLGGDWGKRQLLVFEKTAPLSKKYPRKRGVPKKEPLK